MPNRQGSKHSGGLMQLVANGAPDLYITGNTGSPYCCNNRNSMMYWFINRENGEAIDEDMYSCIDMPGILDHVPPPLRFLSIKKERAVFKIQKAWKNANLNPKYFICKKRLLREFNELQDNL